MAASHDLLGLHGKASLPQSVNWSKTKVFTTIPVTEDRAAGGTSEYATGPGSGFVGTTALASGSTRELS